MLKTESDPGVANRRIHRADFTTVFVLVIAVVAAVERHFLGVDFVGVHLGDPSLDRDQH